MRRRNTLMAVLVAAVTLSGCDLIEETGSGDETSFDVAQLAGVTLVFNNPNFDAGIGEQEFWQYTYNAGGTVTACNQLRDFTATGWRTVGGDQVEVGFAQGGDPYQVNAREMYTFSNVSGSTGGSLEGNFRVQTDVNEAFGTFRQAAGGNTIC